MRSSELKRAKRRVRSEVLAVRDSLEPERRAAMGALVADRFLALTEVDRAATVLVFWSFGSEVPTGPLIDRLHARGTAVALPRIEGEELMPVRYDPGDPTTPTSFGAREPVGGVRIPVSELDAVAVPGIAFDRRGHRIGYGGGYYDRFLRTTPAVAIGLAFDVQVVADELPAGGTDVGVDMIVTERETIRIPPDLDLNSRSTS